MRYGQALPVAPVTAITWCDLRVANGDGAIEPGANFYQAAPEDDPPAADAASGACLPAIPAGRAVRIFDPGSARTGRPARRPGARPCCCWRRITTSLATRPAEPTADALRRVEPDRPLPHGAGAGGVSGRETPRLSRALTLETPLRSPTALAGSPRTWEPLGVFWAGWTRTGRETAPGATGAGRVTYSITVRGGAARAPGPARSAAARFRDGARVFASSR